MTPVDSSAALDCVAELLSRLKKPENLLGAASDVAACALNCTKAFIDLSGENIVVDNFTDEQIWAALDLCKHDARSVKDELKALKRPRLLKTGTDDDDDALPKKKKAKREKLEKVVPEEKSRKKKKAKETWKDDKIIVKSLDMERKKKKTTKKSKDTGEKEKKTKTKKVEDTGKTERKHPLDDDFFKMEDMAKFLAENDEPLQDSDDDFMVDYEENGDEKMTYWDFFGDEGERREKAKDDSNEQNVGTEDKDDKGVNGMGDAVDAVSKGKEHEDEEDDSDDEEGDAEEEQEDDELAEEERQIKEKLKKLETNMELSTADEDSDEEYEGEGEDGELAEEKRAIKKKFKKLEKNATAEDDNDDEDEESEGLVDDSDAELSAGELELDRLLDEYRAEGDIRDDFQDEDGVPGDQEGDGEDEDEDGDEVKRDTLVSMDKRIRDMEEEIERMEDEQVKDKHWTLKGEANARQRPMNSLLETHLDLPMSCFASKRAVDQAISLGQVIEEDPLDDSAPVAFDIEGIIRQRIADKAFDDVVRIAGKPPALEKDQDTQEVLDFNKSRIGLADIYAKQYEQEIFGEATAQEETISREKQIMKKIFAKTIYKLDQLTNSHFTPRPPMIVKGKKLGVASIKMEEAVPLVMTTSQQRAPEEQMAPLKTTVASADMTPEDRDAHRRASKVKRKKTLLQKVKDGRMTEEDMKKRSEKLAQKNKKTKDEKAAKGKPKEVKKKKLKSSELLAQAADRTEKDISRKAAMHEFRKTQLADGFKSSKRLKL